MTKRKTHFMRKTPLPKKKHKSRSMSMNNYSMTMNNYSMTANKYSMTMNDFGNGTEGQPTTRQRHQR